MADRSWSHRGGFPLALENTNILSERPSLVMAIAHLPYTDPSKKLVLAFDIGTTHSRVSYVLLEPGIVPEIKTVGR